MIHFSFTFGYSESKVIFKGCKKKNMLNKKALQGANDCNSCISFSLGSELSQWQAKTVNIQKSPPWACNKWCAECFSNLKVSYDYGLIHYGLIHVYIHVWLFSDWHLVQLPLQIITISCPLSHLSNSIFWCIIKEQTALWLANLDLTLRLFPDESKSEWKEGDSNIQQCSCGGLLRYFIVSAYHKNIVK